MILKACSMSWQRHSALRLHIEDLGLPSFLDRARIRGVPLFTCFVDIQKAYDSVQHPLLWARLQKIGVHGEMLAAIQSLYSSGTISMKIGGTVGPPEVQQMGVRQGCPLSPTLFGL